MQWTGGRRYEASGVNFKTAKVRRVAETRLPSQTGYPQHTLSKDRSAQTRLSHATHRLLHTPLVSAHFSARRYPALRWRSFISKQRVIGCDHGTHFSMQQALAKCAMCTMVTANDPNTVVAFGDAKFAHNSRGWPGTLTRASGDSWRARASCIKWMSTTQALCAVLAMSTCQAWALKQVWAQITNPDVAIISAL